jgi:hypothetical protein
MNSTKSMSRIATLAVTATAALFLTAVSGNTASLSSRKAEFACQKALDIGSKSALRAFLRTYPKTDTACNALASTASSVPFSLDNRSDSRTVNFGPARSPSSGSVASNGGGNVKPPNPQGGDDNPKPPGGGDNPKPHHDGDGPPKPHDDGDDHPKPHDDENHHPKPHDDGGDNQGGEGGHGDRE